MIWGISFFSSQPTFVTTPPHRLKEVDRFPCQRNKKWKWTTLIFSTYTEWVFEAVWRCFLITLSVLLSFLQKSRAFACRNRCLCMGLKRARSFTFTWPFLCSVHTLNDPASSDAPDHWGCPESNRSEVTATPKATYIIGNHFNSKWTLNFTACVNDILTSYPVMAIRCMESFTAFRMPRIDESASCRSSSPSQPLLFFSSSWQKHTWTQRLHQWEVQTWGTYLDIYSGSSLPSVRAGIWLFSALVWAGTSPNQAYVPVSFDTPENNTHTFSLYFFTMVFLLMTMMIIIIM